jgi:hypothetical protein
MDRLDNITQTLVDTLRTQLQTFDEYVGKTEPLPGSALKLDDDVMWLGVLPMRVLWGYETPDYYFAICPDIDPEGYSYFEGTYITDRAPLDPEETPMPIWPQQAQQKQHGDKKHDPKRALHDLLKRLTPEQAKKVRAMFKAKRPELLDEKHA